MVQLHQRLSKKQAKLSMPPQWGQTLSSRILIQNHFVTHESFMQEYMKLKQGLSFYKLKRVSDNLT